MNSLDRAIRLFESNDIGQAGNILEDLVNADPKNEQANFLLGICHYRMGKYDHAEARLRLVVSLNNVHFKAIYYLGLIAEKNGNSSGARQYYRRALEIKPDFEEAKNRLGDDTGSSQERRDIHPQKGKRAKPVNTGTVSAARRNRPQPETKGCLYLVFAATRGLLLIAAGIFTGSVVGRVLFREAGMIAGGIAGLVVAQIINAKFFGKKK